MKTVKAHNTGYHVIISFFLVLFQFVAFPSHATDVKELLREISSDLRQAERNMFGGKAEQAIAALETIKAKILQAKEVDPNNPQVKTSENKFKKLVKDLERRTGKDLGGGSLTAAGAGTKTDLPPQPSAKPLSRPAEQAAAPAKPGPEATDQLPHAARRPVQNARGDLSRVDGAVEKMSDPKWNHKQLLGNMNSYLDSARKNLASGREEAAKRGVTSHPEFDELETGIKEAEVKIAEAHKSYEAAQEEAARQAEEVTADVKALKDEYDRVNPVFQRANGYAVHYNDLKPVVELIEMIENFKQNDLNELRKHMQAFGEKYGTTRDAIDKKADAMGYVDSYYRASYAYTELAQGIENVEKTRPAMAEDLIRRAGDMKDRTSKGVHDFFRQEQHSRIKEWGQMAARFDPALPKVKSFNSEIDEWIKADAEALNEKIDKAVFPAHAPDAPEDVKSLVKEAMVFLQRENENLAAEKGGEVSHVVAVAVTGPWRVFSKNILGEPIQYNLPIATAVQRESEKSWNLARVYLSTLLTREMKGVAMGPPFTGVTMGDSYYIRPSAIKK